MHPAVQAFEAEPSSLSQAQIKNSSRNCQNSDSPATNLEHIRDQDGISEAEGGPSANAGAKQPVKCTGPPGADHCIANPGKGGVHQPLCQPKADAIGRLTAALTINFKATGVVYSKIYCVLSNCPLRPISIGCRGQKAELPFAELLSWLCCRCRLRIKRNCPLFCIQRIHCLSQTVQYIAESAPVHTACHFTHKQLLGSCRQQHSSQCIECKSHRG